MTSELKEELRRYSLSSEEKCGFIVLNIQNELLFVPTENIHEDKKNFFKINPSELSRIKKYNKVIAIFHSHPKTSSLPSPFDKESSRAQALPYIIYGRKDDAFYCFQPKTYKCPKLEDRKYVRGIYDEVTFLKDFFLNSSLLDYEDQESLNFLNVKKELIDYYINKLGYRKVNDRNLKPLDLIFFNDPHLRLGICLGQNKFLTQTSFYSSVIQFTAIHSKKMCNLYRKV